MACLPLWLFGVWMFGVLFLLCCGFGFCGCAFVCGSWVAGWCVCVVGAFRILFMFGFVDAVFGWFVLFACLVDFGGLNLLGFGW